MDGIFRSYPSFGFFGVEYFVEQGLVVVLVSRIVLVLMFSAVHGYDCLNALFVLTISLMISGSFFHC